MQSLTIALRFSRHSYLNRLGLFPEAMHTSSASVALLYMFWTFKLKLFLLSSVHLL